MIFGIRRRLTTGTTAQMNVPRRVTDGSPPPRPGDVADDDAQPRREREQRGDERSDRRPGEAIDLGEGRIERCLIERPTGGDPVQDALDGSH